MPAEARAAVTTRDTVEEAVVEEEVDADGNLILGSDRIVGNFECSSLRE
jgi:hypothetical protein